MSLPNGCKSVADVAHEARSVSRMDEPRPNVKDLRPLSLRERDLLIAVLSRWDTAQAHQLLVQVEGASVRHDGPLSLDIEINKSITPAEFESGVVPVRAFVEDAGSTVGEIIVWIADGCLSGLEFPWYTDIQPVDFPDQSQLRFE